MAKKGKNSAVQLERDKILNVYSDVLSHSGNWMQKKKVQWCHTTSPSLHPQANSTGYRVVTFQSEQRHQKDGGDRGII